MLPLIFFVTVEIIDIMEASGWPLRAVSSSQVVLIKEVPYGIRKSGSVSLHRLLTEEQPKILVRFLNDRDSCAQTRRPYFSLLIKCEMN